jgi:hypothetical protein
MQVAAGRQRGRRRGGGELAVEVGLAVAAVLAELDFEAVEAVVGLDMRRQLLADAVTGGIAVEVVVAELDGIAVVAVVDLEPVVAELGIDVVVGLDVVDEPTSSPSCVSCDPAPAAERGVPRELLGGGVGDGRLDRLGVGRPPIAASKAREPLGHRLRERHRGVVAAEPDVPPRQERADHLHERRVAGCVLAGVRDGGAEQRQLER